MEEKLITVMSPFSGTGEPGFFPLFLSRFRTRVRDTRYIRLYTFVEGIAQSDIHEEERTPELRYRLSGIEIPYFHANEKKIGICNPQNLADRNNRRNHLQEVFPKETIWDIYGGVTDQENKEIVNVLFQEAVWIAILLDTNQELGPICYREKFNAPDNDDRSDDDRSDDDRSDDEKYSLAAVGAVHPRAVVRLEEIFSLNHIPDAPLGGGAGVPFPPPSPLGSDPAFAGEEVMVPPDSDQIVRKRGPYFE